VDSLFRTPFWHVDKPPLIGVVDLDRVWMAGGNAAMCRFFKEQAGLTLGHYMVDMDTATLAGAVGVPVELPEHEAGRCEAPLLRSLEAVDSLPPVDISKYWAIQNWLEGVRRIKKNFDREKAVRRNCDQCPFSLASVNLAAMVEVAHGTRR
jgi:hypothetical protein